MTPYSFPIQHLGMMGQLALLALLDPVVHRVPLPFQEERPMSAGGRQRAQMLLEQSSFMLALPQVVTLTKVEEPITSAQ